MADREFSVFSGARTHHFTIPEEHVLYYAAHEKLESIPDPDTLAREAVTHPIGGSSLSDILEGAKVAIIVDDATRMTPTVKIIPAILREVLKKTDHIMFITAPGTHRPMREEEIEAKLGKEIAAQYPVVNVDAWIAEDYAYVGETRNTKVPIDIHKSVLEAEYRIAIGTIGPHTMAGWSGGAKMLMPGVAGKRTVEGTHYRGTYTRVADTIANLDNPNREDIDEIGTIVGLDYIANAVLDEDGNMLALFCVHYLEAHRAGVAYAEKALMPEIPSLADIVIVSAFPACQDYWQGEKPISYAMAGLRQGGVAIFLFDPPEGMCNNSPVHKATLEKYLLTD